jgi:hypothetical protein
MPIVDHQCETRTGFDANHPGESDRYSVTPLRRSIPNWAAVSVPAYGSCYGFLPSFLLSWSVLWIGVVLEGDQVMATIGKDLVVGLAGFGPTIPYALPESYRCVRS